MTKAVNLVLIILVLGIFCVPGIFAQTTEISYQGSLQDTSAPANGNYDIEFRLYGAETGGSQIGASVSKANVAVVDGVFSVKIDFGAAGFPGQDRFLEIAVRRTGVGSLVTLGPRQKIGSAPYAVQSLQAANATTSVVANNALALGGVSASQYIVTTDTRLTDNRNPIGGSPSYIQNTSSQQAASNFNVSGTGTAGIFSATNRYNFGTEHVLSAPGLDNIFAGSVSGLLNTGNNNAFFGAKAGQENKQGSFNAFFGSYAGQNNVTGNNNSFFGYFAGNATTTGNDNSFFGHRAGQVNTSGAFNSFFGTFSGFFNATGSDNSYFGNETGFNNTNGNRNSFFGSRAGRANTSGADNAFLGSFAGNSNQTGSNNSFVGSNAGQANTSGINNTFMGSRAGFTNTASNNSFFGTEAGHFTTSGANNTFVGRNSGRDNTTGELNVFIGTNAGIGNQLGRMNTIVGSEANVVGSNLSYATAIGAEATVNTSNTVVIGRSADSVRIPGSVNVLGTLSATSLSVQATTITGVIPTANGGTGLSSAGVAGRFLRSDGGNWQSLPLLATDIPSGATNYIQNGTTQQGSANFNINGNGTVGGTLWGNAVNSTTQYNINGIRVLSTPGLSNLFAGVSAGNGNTTGSSNSFFGASSGLSNTSGGGNSFFGTNAGQSSSSGGNNTFAGSSSGSGNTIGGNNSFFGANAGQNNTIGGNNTVLGANANVGSNNLTYATAIGSDAVVSTNNTVVLGRSVDTVRTPGNLQVDGTLTAANFSIPASSLTGTVAVANGGTGMSSPGASGNYLRSNGSIWQSSAIAAGDIPSGSTHYVQNGTGEQTSASFNVGGTGTVGGLFSANTVNSTLGYNIAGTRVLSNTGTANIFVGAGTATTGSNNSFFGFGAGAANTTGFSNTIIGNGANVGAGNLSFATALGAGATVSNSNSVVLGRAADTVRVPGNLVLGGTLTAPSFTLPASSITGTLAAANGGTGLSSPGTAGNFLRSTGTGWQSEGLDSTDVPSGSTFYIQNGTGLQTGASFNVGGSGAIVGNLNVGGTITGNLPASNVTGTLAVGNGGTGLSSAGTINHFLKSTGTGFTTAALTANDIPSLATSYIQNNPSSQQGGANFNVGGSGTIGTNLNVNGNLTVGGAISGSFTVPAGNITGTLGMTNGGTGVTSSGSTGNVLRSNGTTWTSSQLQASDIPDLGATYIHNSPTQQAGANFNVGGHGTIGGNLTVNGAINGNVAATNLTGTVGIANGGTGLTSAGTSGHFLKSTGGGFTTAALIANDIPSLASSYIQNNPSSQQTGANFNVGGTGTIGSHLSVGGNLSVTGTITGSFSVPAANISGVVGASQGGTGLSSSTGTQFLRGNNGGGWTSGTLTANDIPSLVTSYIQNAPGSPQSGSFNVTGSGTVGSNMSVGGNLSVTGTITGSFSVPAANITGTVGIASGGTGLSSAGTGGHFLKSTGSGFTTAALTAAELPAGSANYLQISPSSAQSGNFNVAGTGTVGGNMSVGGNLNVTGSITGGFTVPAANISGTLGIASGGTGLASAGTGGHFLKSTGTGFATSALTAAELPAGSTSYIQNGSSTQTGTSFAVDGSGSVGSLSVTNNASVGGNMTVTGGLTVNGAFTGSFTVPAGNITGTLGIASGGTGLTSAGTGGHFLKSTGSGFTTAALTAAELPAGSGSYIQNGTSPQTGNFSVNGSGSVGTTMTVGTTMSANAVNSATQYNIGGNRVLATSGSTLSVGDNAANNGSSNVFVGNGAGQTNGSSGSSNTLVGANADVGSGSLNNATAIGANAQVTQSNSVVLGSSSAKVGIGTTAPKEKLEVSGNVYISDPGQGVILRPASGTTCTLLKADGVGGLTVSSITCP